MKSDKKIWFKPKRYGWGFFPVSIEGVLMTLVLFGLVFLSAGINGFFVEGDHTVVSIGRFVLDLVFLIFSFSRLAEKYMDGELRWRWGK